MKEFRQEPQWCTSRRIPSAKNSSGCCRNLCTSFEENLKTFLSVQIRQNRKTVSAGRKQHVWTFQQYGMQLAHKSPGHGRVLTPVSFVLYCGRVPAASAPGMHCSRRLIVQTLVFSRSYLHHQVSPPETLVVKGATTWTRNGRWILPENVRLPRNIQWSFTCRKSTTWDKTLYFPSEGRRAEDFSALKNPTASAGFEPVNLGTRGQHATSRSSKLLSHNGHHTRTLFKGRQFRYQPVNSHVRHVSNQNRKS